jgi:predicted enzyme related to lactoylglutathione lyase
MSDTPEFKYATVTVDGDQVLGIMDFSAEMRSSMPAYWNNYFKVADCDEAARRVIEQGGDVIMEPTDTPYGRMAAARDRNGAVFSLMHNPS